MVDEFKVIKIMNEAKIEILKEKNINCDLNIKIKEKLEDEAFFFKIKKEETFEILKNIGVKEDQMEKVFNNLVSADRFFFLIKKGVIAINDNNLIIKYNYYNADNLFRNK